MEGRLHDFPIQVPDCQLPYGRRDWRWGELLIVKRWNLPPISFVGQKRLMEFISSPFPTVPPPNSPKRRRQWSSS